MDLFIDLFQGNRAAIGTELGGCARLTPEQIWSDQVRFHLEGTAPPIGVYPLVFVPRGWFVHWGCVDFDEGEAFSRIHAQNLQLILNHFGITGWVERSRSKGYHVWVFAQNWTPAKLMREALLAACQLVDAPTKEINPKSIELPEGSLGNYVRLPYPGHLGGSYDPTRRVMLDGEKPWPLATFVNTAHAKRTAAVQLEKLAAFYAPPRPPIRRRDWEKSELTGRAIDRLVGKARVIFDQGPFEGSGRGHTLYKLACYLREDGRHTREEALELVRDADARWGKFHLRPDCEIRLQSVIDEAWAKGG